MDADITLTETPINATFKLEIVPDISGLATKAEVAAVEAEIPDVTGFATKTELSAVENQIPDISGLATKTEVAAVENEIPDITGLATKTELSAVEAQIPTVPTNVSAFTNDSNYVSSTVLSQNLPVSNALETGTVSTNSTVYADILSRLHTSFDLSKFTVTGSPTITDNGIASGFGMSGYIFNNANDLSSALKNCDEFSINIGFTPQANTVDERYQLVFGIVENASGTGSTPILFNINKTGNKFSFKFEANPPYSISVGNSHLVQLIYNWTNLTMKVILDGVLIDTANYDLTGKFDTPKYALFGYDGGGLQWVNYGSIDLKQFSIKADGVTVFNGNKTGTDSYTIGGNTVTVPYTLTSGGAKIADSAYRTAIQSVYAENGFAPYYTIDETNQNFTLPMGDLYGMLQKLSDRISALET